MNGTIEIDIFDKVTTLSELRDVLGWNSTQENTSRLVMVLCQRIEALERRIAQLESLESNEVSE